jgi:ferric-dicitrate binding protein FerR (iron transport regulator)
MNCQEARQLLPRQLDRLLPGDEQALLSTHLSGCASCGVESAAQARTDALLTAALTDHPFGDAAVEQILTALPPAQAPITRLRFAPLGAGVAAAAALLLAALLMFGERDVDRLPDDGPRVVASAQGSGWMRLDGESGEELEAGASLAAGDRLVALTTPAVLKLSDGTRVDAHADTEVSLREDADGGLAVVMESDGRVFCDVAKRAQPFRVVARDMTVEVLGTQFAVDREVTVSRVVVVEGRVEAMAVGDRRVLTVNQGAELRFGMERLEVLEVTARDWVGWHPGVAPQPAEPASPTQPAEATTPRPVETRPAARPSPTDPSLDTPVLPPGRDELPPGEDVQPGGR